MHLQLNILPLCLTWLLVFEFDREMKGFFMLKRIFYLATFIFVSLFADWEEMSKVVSVDRASNDNFGYTTAIDGDYVIVGTPNQDYDADGANYLANMGAVYIYHRVNTTWSFMQKIVQSPRNYTLFGSSVDISGNYAIVGNWANPYDENEANTLSSAGAAWIYYNDNGTWVQQQKIVAPDRASSDRFGNTVAISGDYAVVAAPLEDEDATGLNTLSMAGSVYIYKRSGSTWSFEQKIVNSDRAENDQFGIDVAIEGNYIIVGAHQEDEDADGNNPYSNAGSAYIFFNNSSTWSEQQKIVSDGRSYIMYFGYSCAIQGDRVIVGSHSTNKAWIFSRTDNIWSQEGTAVPSDGSANDWYGNDLDIYGDYAIVGAWGEDEDAAGSNTMEKAGSAYIYKYDSGWSQVQKIVASDRYTDDYFGYSVGISGNYFTVGAEYEDIDGTHPNAGAVYFFGNASEVPLPITLASFTATAVNGSVELAWKTATETNNARFVIYRNGEAIGSVEGAGTTTEPQSYTFFDDAVVPGVTYTYVLADVDYANTETKYEDEAVTVTLGNDVMEADFTVGTAYPNPFNPNTVISMHYAVGRNTVANIYNTQGVLVDQLINGFLEAGHHNIIWDASNMTSGVYILQVLSGDVVNTQKLVLMK